MKKLLPHLLLALLVVGWVFADVISVTGFHNNTSNLDVDWIGESIADNITSDLVKISSLNIVNRKDLKKILQEQKFQQSGLVDLEKSVEIGVDEISFLHCDRSIKKTIKNNRISNVAITAMKQSGKAKLPIINDLVNSY